jgi:hypothetical protein
MSASVQPAIVPTRGCHVRPGMVVKPTPSARCRVLWRFQVSALWIVGEWLIEDERADDLSEGERVQPFELFFINFYTVEKGGEALATRLADTVRASQPAVEG